MAIKSNFSIKQNPWAWGDEHPEKIKQRSSHSMGAKQQLKSLFSPEAWTNQLFGQKKDQESLYYPPQIERKKTYRETLIFSRATSEEEEKLNKETKEILQTLKEQIVLLEKSEKNLVAEVSKVKVEQLPQKTSIYYLRFLEWLLTIIRQLRVKVEEGRAWLTTFNQRKKKRLGYWSMYKKHGTTFGLSHERTLATQTG